MEKWSQQEFCGDKAGILTVVYTNNDALLCYTLSNQKIRWYHFYQCKLGNFKHAHWNKAKLVSE